MTKVKWLMITLMAVTMIAAAAVLTGCHNSETVTSGNAAVKYTCPMHPEVVQETPGSCPKCNMKLVEKK